MKKHSINQIIENPAILQDFSIYELNALNSQLTAIQFPAWEGVTKVDKRKEYKHKTTFKKCKGNFKGKIRNQRDNAFSIIQSQKQAYENVYNIERLKFLSTLTKAEKKHYKNLQYNARKKAKLESEQQSILLIQKTNKLSTRVDALKGLKHIQEFNKSIQDD